MKSRGKRGRLPARGGSSLRGRLLKAGIVLAAFPLIVAAAFLIRYYYLFNGLIDQKLLRPGSYNESEIYAAPARLQPGQRMAMPELVALLRRLGYLERTAQSGPDLSLYEVSGETVTIHNSAAAPFDRDRSAVVVCAGGTVRSLLDLRGRKEIPSFTLLPALLSNAIGESREKRRYVPYREIPKTVVDAVLAAEDRRFFAHRGVDPFRIVGALIVDLRKGDTVEGASTITQQFAKNYFLTPERTWRRKIAEAYLSILLERRLSKEQIFELYCNEIYLGQRSSFSIVGLGEAAQAYFGKNIKDLALGEAAMLAGIIRAPNRFTPLRYPERAKARRDLVLGEMAQYGMITSAQYEECKSLPLGVKPAALSGFAEAPYFVDYVQDLLLEKIGDVDLSHNRYRVFTTLNAELQQAADESMRIGLAEVDAALAKGKNGIPPGTVQSSLIAVDPRDGRILAMIGGRDYGRSQFNRITQAKRQPGSIFKPLVYTAALETATYTSPPLTAASTILDEPTQFAFQDLLYEPRNFKQEYMGQVTMRQAITKSLNIATIKFAEKVGYDKVAGLAKRLRLNALIKPYPSMAIGSFEVTPLEMVRAYTAFAGEGKLTELTPIARILDARSQPVYQALPKRVQVLSPQMAFMITSLLKSVINNGTGAGARTRGFKFPAAGKTGTSRDGWFAGFTPDLLCIVWVGFDDNRELPLSGGQSALPIWTEFMKRAATRLPLQGSDFEIPDEIVQVEIDPTTGLLATPRCLERIEEYFVQGTEPTIACYGNSYEQMLTSLPGNPMPTAPREPPAGAGGRKEGAELERKPAKKNP